MPSILGILTSVRMMRYRTLQHFLVMLARYISSMYYPSLALSHLRAYRVFRIDSRGIMLKTMSSASKTVALLQQPSSSFDSLS